MSKKRSRETELELRLLEKYEKSTQDKATYDKRSKSPKTSIKEEKMSPELEPSALSPYIFSAQENVEFIWDDYCIKEEPVDSTDPNIEAYKEDVAITLCVTRGDSERNKVLNKPSVSVKQENLPNNHLKPPDIFRYLTDTQIKTEPEETTDPNFKEVVNNGFINIHTKINEETLNSLRPINKEALRNVQQQMNKSIEFNSAHLEALNNTSLLVELEELSDNQANSQSFAELQKTCESVSDKIEKEHLLECQRLIKKELLDSCDDLTDCPDITVKREAFVDSNENFYSCKNISDSFTIENCTETTLISVRAKNLVESISENSKQTHQELNQRLSPKATLDYCTKDDMQADEVLSNKTGTIFKISKNLRPCLGPDPSWQILSRYIDLALKEIVLDLATSGMANEVLMYSCEFCGKVYANDGQKPGTKAFEYSLERFRSHLNYVHLNDGFILNKRQNVDKSITILAQKVPKSNTDYSNLISKAHSDVCAGKLYLHVITNCLTKVKKRLLSYKCYACKLSYEFLNHYIEHLKTHSLQEEMNISTELINSVFVNIIAFRRKPLYQNLPVVSTDANNPLFKCLQCKANFERDNMAYVKHLFKKPCLGCYRRFHCFQLHEHIGKCSQYIRKAYPKTCSCRTVVQNAAGLNEHRKTCSIKDSSMMAFICVVCYYMAKSPDLLLQHQTYTHTVQSDELVLSYEVIGRVSTNKMINSVAKLPLSFAPCKKMKIMVPDDTVKEIAGQTTDEKKSQHDLQTETLEKPLKTKVKPKVIRKKLSIPTPTGPCPICVYRRPYETLERHMLLNHLVRSDVKVSYSSCEKCSFLGDALAVWRHIILKHNEVKQFPAGTDRRNMCMICLEVCRTEKRLNKHFIKKHNMRLNEPKWLCLTKSSYSCPKKLDTVCLYCHKTFENNSFLACHNKGQQMLQCTKCNEVIKSCMQSQHRELCDGTNTAVYECLKCGFKEDMLDAIESHCVGCFSSVELANKKLLAQQLMVPKESISEDPTNDHFYTNRQPKAQVKAEIDEMSTQSEIGETAEEYLRIKQELGDVDITEHTPYYDYENKTLVYPYDKNVLIQPSNVASLAGGIKNEQKDDVPVASLAGSIKEPKDDVPVVSLAGSIKNVPKDYVPAAESLSKEGLEKVKHEKEIPSETNILSEAVNSEILSKTRDKPELMLSQISAGVAKGIKTEPMEVEEEFEVAANQDIKVYQDDLTNWPESDEYFYKCIDATHHLRRHLSHFVPL